MRQRVVIAIALACDPDLLICDEPTTALDVTIQAKILELIQRVQKERGISVIYITHDLGVVAKIADYVNVMYAGRIVEKGTVDEIFYDPRHPYTWGLLSAMPHLDTEDARLYTIPGSPPNLLHVVSGDAFAPRNKYALNIDKRVEPPMFKVSDTHYAATWLLDERAPRVEMPAELRRHIDSMLKGGGTRAEQ
jgi:oligopeptide transport system ATP-binding protein